MSAKHLEGEPSGNPVERKPMLVPERIPALLKDYPQWVLWRYIDRGAGRKPDKQPVNPHTLGSAGVHWPNTWGAFAQVVQSYQDATHGHPRYMHAGIAGIGFVLTAQDPFTAIDIDACVQENGVVLPSAIEVITQVHSYTEISPSGQGIRILVICPDFADNRRTPTLELYSHDRYVTLTGNHLAGTPLTITPVQAAALSALVPEPLSPPPLPAPRLASAQGEALSNRPIYRHPGDPPWRRLTNDALWEYIFTHDKFGEAHRARFQGDTSQEPGGDHSYTVIRLLNCLAAWTGCDPIRMRQMMLLSPLKNDKWFEPRGTTGDWLDYQIHDAIRYRSGRT